jgi:hypothetical protein
MEMVGEDLEYFLAEHLEEQAGQSILPYLDLEVQVEAALQVIQEMVGQVHEDKELRVHPHPQQDFRGWQEQVEVLEVEDQDLEVTLLEMQ